MCRVVGGPQVDAELRENEYGHPVRAGISLLVTVATVIALAGCGGGSKSEPPATPGVGAAFAARALAVCEAALADKKGWAAFPVSDFDPTKPDAAKFPQVAAWLEDEVAPTFHAWSEDLKALGSPPSATEAWNSMLAAIAKIARLNDDQIAAAKAGDVDAFAAATNGLAASQDEQLVSFSAKAGVPACADVHAA